MALRIPRLLNPREATVSIVPFGNGWFVEPVKSARWPAGFFEQIHIKDAAFRRPKQGKHRPVEL